MTIPIPTTKRRFILAIVLVALTLPAEWVLVKAMSTDAATESAQWAETQPQSSLQLAAESLEDYPYEYRREILRRLDTRGRIAAWTAVIVRYRDSHPDLEDAQVDILNTAIEAVRFTLSNPGPETAKVARFVGERAEALLGKEVARELLHQAGPLRVRFFAGSLPWHLRATDFVRTRLVVQADVAPCDCNVDFGCRNENMKCSAGNGGCAIESNWPACGWLWLEDCNGTCAADGQSGLD